MTNFTMYDREREFKWQIECQLRGGTNAYIDAEDIYSGRLTRQISSGEGIEVGSCYVSELDLTIVASALPANVVSVKPYFRLLTSTEIVEGVVRKYYTPYNLGVFKIASTKRKEYGRIDLVCYDKMAELDTLIAPAAYTELLASDWKPFYLLDWIATKVNVTYTFTQSSIEAMPNGTLYFKLAEETSNIKTYRDLLQYVCMLIGAYGIFDEDGHLNVKTFADVTSYSLPASFRFSESFGDVPITYSGVELTVKNATTMFGNASNTVVRLSDNPFLYTLSNLNQTTDYATFIMQFLRNIYTEFQGLSYYAGEFEIPPDASLNVGRLLAVTGGGASDTINCFLQKIDVNFDGRMMLSCGNPNTYVARTQNRTTSSIANLTNRIETLESSQGSGKEVYYGTSEPSDTVGENGNVYYEVIEKSDDTKTLEILDSIYIISGAFNTTYTHKLTTSVILNVTATSGSNFLIGAGGSVANARFTVRLQGGSTARFEIGNNNASKDNVGFTSGNVSASIPEQTMTLAGENLYIQDISTASEGLAPLLLNSFNVSTSGGIYPSETYSDGRTYYHEIKIYEGGTLVKDFIPVINVDDVTDYGFFDTVNRVYYDLATYGYSNRNVQGGASCVAGNRTGEYVVTSYSSVEKEYVKIKGEWIQYATDSGDTVEVTQSLTSGTEIATISVNNADTTLYAPTPQSVSVTPITTSGTNIANIAVNGTTYNLFAPSGGGGGGSSGSGYTETSLWSGYKSDTGTINLNDSVENYGVILIRMTSHPEQPSNSYYESYFTILPSEIIYNQHWQYNILVVRGAVDYGNGSMDCHFADPTSFVIETINIASNARNVKPAVLEVIGLKFGGSSGHNYSTTEQVIGTWIDGSTVYECTYDLGSDLTLQDSTWTDSGITVPTNANRCIKAEGIQSGGTSTCIMASIASTNITVQSTKNSGDSIRYLTIQYTKTS